MSSQYDIILVISDIQIALKLKLLFNNSQDKIMD